MLDTKIIRLEDFNPIIEGIVLTQILADHLKNIDIYSLHELEAHLEEDDKSLKIFNKRSPRIFPI